MVAARPINMSQFQFTIEHNQGSARVGEFPTPHGLLATPAFMPVGTQAAIKTLTPEEVAAAGVEMLLCNAYHLYLRPGVGTVQRLGGVHRFMGWSGPVLTDSGGFQVFSMGALSRVDESGVLFRSHLDGSEHLFSPERAIANQARLGADIIMCLDHCIGYGAGKEKVRQAMERTHRWAEICHRFHAVSETSGETSGRQALFGIVQGGVFEDLRAESARHITGIPFQGYAIGGLAVGESKAQMYETTKQVTALLPKDRPRYLMGVGSPEDLVECVARGVDLFDCVLPTRVARHGGLFTNHGRVDITSRRFMDQAGPVDADCDCYACRHFSAAYLCHLFRTNELLAPRLASIHNLRFIMRLMADVRRSIAEGRFEVFRREFCETYRPTDEAARREQKAKWLRARKG
jgi:queuine tRNA-ribosyltransferase